MEGLINIYSNDIRNKVKKDIPFIKGAWVEFFDDMLAGFRDEYEAKQKETDSTEIAFWTAAKSISDWNFSGKDEQKLPITAESVKILPLRIQRWILEESTSAVFSNRSNEEKKESPAT